MNSPYIEQQMHQIASLCSFYLGLLIGSAVHVTLAKPDVRFEEIASLLKAL